MKKRGKSRHHRKWTVRRSAKWLLIAVIVGLFVYEYTGPVETVDGTVADTSTYPHTGRGGQSHTHTEAFIEFEGARKRLPRADGLTQGQQVLVRAKKGRISGRLRYVSHEATTSAAGPSQPEPWGYDWNQDRHWNPEHGHWHDGRPPPPSQR